MEMCPTSSGIYGKINFPVIENAILNVPIRYARSNVRLLAPTPPTPMPVHAHLASFLRTHLPQLTAVPTDLQPYVHTAGTDGAHATPWWLAERIVVSAFEDPSLEADVCTLIDRIRQAVAEQALVAHGFAIAEALFDVVIAVLAAPTLQNLFTEENALLTVYFTTVFVVCCAFGGKDENHDGVDDGAAMVAQIREHEELWVRLARLSSKLLLNRQVYEFVTDVREGRCANVVGRVVALVRGGCAGR